MAPLGRKTTVPRVPASMERSNVRLNFVLFIVRTLKKFLDNVAHDVKVRLEKSMTRKQRGDWSK